MTQISEILNQSINEGDVLELTYSALNSGEDSDFYIYDVDSPSINILHSSSPDVLYRLIDGCADGTICLKTVNENWNGNSVVFISLEDNDYSNPPDDINKLCFRGYPS